MGLGLASRHATRQACRAALADGSGWMILRAGIRRMRGALLDSLLLRDGADALTDSVLTSGQLISAVGYGCIDGMAPDRGVGASSAGEGDGRTGAGDQSGRDEARRRFDQRR